MNKVLSQEEVDALLQGMSGGEIEVETGAGSGADGVVVYDLTNQDRIIRGRMPTLEIINDRFARLFRTTISTSLRKIVDITTTSVDMVKFGEFMRSLPVPTSLHIFKMDPLRGHAVFVLESKLVFNLVETFFGGTGTGEVKVEGRDFTAIEQQLTRKVVLMALQDLEQAWKPVHDLTMVYQRTENNPQFASIVPPSDVVIVVKFEMEMEHAAGTITVCIPYSTIEPIRNKLYAGFQSDQLEVDHEWMRRFRAQLRDAEIEISVEVGRVEIVSGDLLNFKVGDVITLDKDITEPLVALVQGVPKFLGRAGTFKGNKAIKVEGYY
ncbi:MAG: flagellar motor switch protein FliM [Desulfarculales bacterium]|jgi:flagellar motor switch protein FliM|nr:flagellar motor switch protein FliM [Desulfarculales bacterium]